MQKASIDNLRSFLQAAQERKREKLNYNVFSLLEDEKIYDSKKLYQISEEADYDAGKLQERLIDEDYKFFLSQANISQEQQKKIKASLGEKLGTALRVLFGPLTSILGIGSTAFELLAVGGITTFLISKLIFLGAGGFLGIAAGAYSAFILKRETKKIMQEMSHRLVELQILKKANLAKTRDIDNLHSDIKDILSELKATRFLSIIQEFEQKKIPSGAIGAIYQIKNNIAQLTDDLATCHQLIGNEIIEDITLKDSSFRNAKFKIKDIGEKTLSPNKTSPGQKPVTNTEQDNKMHFEDITAHNAFYQDLNTDPGPRPFQINDWLSKKNTKTAVITQVLLTGLGVAAGAMVFTSFLTLVGLSNFVLPGLLPAALLCGGIFAASYFYGLYKNAQRNHELNQIKEVLEYQGLVKNMLQIRYEIMHDIKTELVQIINTIKSGKTMAALIEKKSVCLNNNQLQVSPAVTDFFKHTVNASGNDPAIRTTPDNQTTNNSLNAYKRTYTL